MSNEQQNKRVVSSLHVLSSQSASFSYSSPSNLRIDFRARLNTISMIVFMRNVYYNGKANEKSLMNTKNH